MCGGFQTSYTDPNTGETKTRKTYFPIAHAQIPYLDGETIKLVQWGRRKGEDEQIDVPQTGWARLESLVEHKWDRYHPQRVRVPVISWMEKDASKQSHWFDMAPETYLLGVKIDKADRSFVYIVTQSATEWFKPIHDREPMIVALESPHVKNPS